MSAEEFLVADIIIYIVTVIFEILLIEFVLTLRENSKETEPDPGSSDHGCDDSKMDQEETF